MKTFVDKNKKMHFTYPDHWDLEENENALAIYDPINGSGALQISTYNVPEPQSIVIKDELKEFIQERHNEVTINYKNNLAYTPYLIDQEKRYWKYWLILKNNTIIFCSYNCQKEDFGKEEKVLNEIINSLMNN